MKIVIGIPCYKAFPYLVYSLGSIIQQTNVEDISIIMSFDNDPTANATIEYVEKYYRQYLSNIFYIEGNEKLGPGGNRNRILEAVYNESYGKFDYLMFMDQDDSLWSVISISQMYYPFTENSDYAATCGLLLTEYGPGLLDNLKNNHQTWIHGKLFNVNFLKKYNLFFPLSTSEDMAFCNMVTWFSHNNQYYYEEPVYFWRCNINSLTRQMTGYLEEGLNGYIESKYYVLNKIKEVDGLEAAKEYGLNTLPFIYYVSADMVLNSTNKLAKEKGEFFIAKFLYEIEAEKYIHSNDKFHTYMYETLNLETAKEMRGTVEEMPMSYEDWIQYYSHYKPFLEVINQNA